MFARRVSLRMPITALAAALAGAMLLPAPAQAAANICNKYCDGRDAALSPVDRQPVSSTLYGRRFVVHVDDTDAMIWASVENGSPTDEVWLDRSFDGGRTTFDSRLGATVIPTGATNWRTAMFNVDNWATRAVGALRACGKAGNRPE